MIEIVDRHIGNSPDSEVAQKMVRVKRFFWIFGESKPPGEEY